MMVVVQRYPSVLHGNWGAATPGKPLWQPLLQSSKEPLGFQAFWACLLGLPGGWLAHLGLKKEAEATTSLSLASGSKNLQRLLLAVLNIRH